MMMERAKTAPAPEPTPTTKTIEEKPTASSAEERVQDLERRLNNLGGESGAAATTTTSTAPVAPVAPAPVVVAPSKPAVQTGKENPLLKRIQAAQERARLAEQKEKEAKAAAAAEIERTKREEEEAKQRAAEQERIAKAQSALRSVAGRALEDKQKDIMMQLEGKQQATAATPGVPIMKTMDPPPPSFDSMKFPPMQQPPVSDQMVGHGMNSRVLSQQQPPAPPPMPMSMQMPAQQQQQAAPPPSFDFLEQQMNHHQSSAPPAPTAPVESPSAPPNFMNAEADHLQGIMPVAPPHQEVQMMPPPPPSFAQFENNQQQVEQQPSPPQTMDAAGEDEGVFEYDMDGNPLSPEQRQVLLDEQRLLYESIMKEKAANDAAIAKARGDAFDLRSSNAAVQAMEGGSGGAGLVAHTQAMDSVGRNVSDYPAAAQERSAAASASEGQAEGQQQETDAEAAQRDRRMVKIGNNQTVALHGQDRTKKAIKEGTAILVQCINCQNWMQVTDTATLMFCPVCQVVSPVIQQNEVLTKEEAIQLTMDRKLAEKLQAEAYADQDGEEENGEGEEEEGYFAKLFGGSGSSPAASATAGAAAASSSAGAAAAAGAASDSWWNKISSIVSYGVADEGERGSMGVTRPPGAAASSQSPTHASVNDNTTSRKPTHTEETRGLLSPVVDGNEANLPSGRVAESKPLFSCMVDGMSNAASAVFSTGQGNVDGIDSSSLLVTNAGRGVGDGAGDYSQIRDQE